MYPLYILQCFVQPGVKQFQQCVFNPFLWEAISQRNKSHSSESLLFPGIISIPRHTSFLDSSQQFLLILGTKKNISRFLTIHFTCHIPCCCKVVCTTELIY